MIKWLFTTLGLLVGFVVTAQQTNEWASTTGNAFNMTYYDMLKDNAGNLYSVGSFKASLDFDPGPSTYSLSLGGSARDGFVQKLDANGNFLWAAGFSAPGWTGSIQHASCAAITCDNNDNVYITGNFIISADFDPGPGTYDVLANQNDIFIVKLDSAGTFQWVRTMGSNYGGNYPKDIQFDPAGFIYTTGYFQHEVDFNTDSGVELVEPDETSSFIHKLDLNGNFIWVKTFDSNTYNGYNEPVALAIDDAHNVYGLGSFTGTQDFNPNNDSLYLSSVGSFDDHYILKLDSSGAFIWAKSIDGNGMNTATDLIIDSSNDLYIAGAFSDSIDLDPDTTNYFVYSDTLTQAYILKLNNTGEYDTSLTFNSSVDVEIHSLSADSDKNIYVAGRYRGILDYDPSNTVLNSNYMDGPDDFASMEEVVYRRYSRLVQEGKDLPQLIIIDGGKGQLSSAVKSLERLELMGQIAIIGIAKKLEEIYFPGDSVPLYLDKRSETLKVIQQARNEAHRFGINHHRNKRSQEALGTSLDNIPGIGPKTIQKLITHFGSVKRVMEANEKELINLVGKEKAKLLHN